MKNHDCVYFWEGGTERGQWHFARPITSGPFADPEDQRTIKGMRAALERMGYHTVHGDSRIGPPEGPPGKKGK